MFELQDNDLLGRNGLITTPKGTIRTPCFVPVVHPEPTKNLIDVTKFQSEFDVDFIITSSYILRNRFDEQIIDLAKQTNFAGPIMTDSGAYQSLVYGEVEITPKNAITYQESIHSDFGVPLDIPIAKSDSYSVAKRKVVKTIERCQNVSSQISNSHTSWVGPIQGGKYLDLVDKCSKEIAKIDTFDMYAIGSVVELMNDYQYATLVDIILTTKQNLDPSKPVHLFGAGHPSMFPLIVAAGCDSFDSAAYSLYAQEGRYITSAQTFHLKELNEFPCSCPVCTSITPQELIKETKKYQMQALAKHNLFICQSEIKNIRRAISSGTLWELVESKALVHPMLWKGFIQLCNYTKQLVKNTPITKDKGIFLFSENSFARPEYYSHQQRLSSIDFSDGKRLILISLLEEQNFETFSLFTKIKDHILNNFRSIKEDTEIWFLDPYFGIIPLEIADIFPLSQYIGTYDFSSQEVVHILEKVMIFIQKYNWSEIIFIGNIKKLNQMQKQTDILTRLQTKIKSFGLNISDNFSTLISVFNIIFIE
jgi:7-cyano-7-deazaguanine tRNA-ribosyltransferase